MITFRELILSLLLVFVVSLGLTGAVYWIVREQNERLTNFETNGNRALMNLGQRLDQLEQAGKKGK